MTSAVLTAAYGSLTLAGGAVILSADHGMVGECGAFVLTGEAAGAAGLWLPAISESIWLRDPYILTQPITVSAHLSFSSAFGLGGTIAAAIAEVLQANDGANSGLVWAQIVSDRAAISAALQLSLGASCEEKVTVAQTSSLALAIAVAQTLFLPDTVLSTLNFTLSVLEAVRTSTAFGNFLGALIGESAILTGLADPLWRFGPVAGDQITLADAAGGSLLIRVDLEDGAEFDDVNALRYIFDGTVSEGLSITAGYVSPTGNFTTWAINTRTSAVTEYQDFVFDSLAQVGRRCVAGDATGLYELNGETDAGAVIVADILSGFMQFGGSRFTALKAAYLGLSSQSGQFVLKLITGDGLTYVYGVTAQNMRTTRVNLGKGLRSRYFRFELINADGKDFSMDAIEFIPLVSTRRI